MQKNGEIRHEISTYDIPVSISREMDMNRRRKKQMSEFIHMSK
jgi:hypothetical protein